MGYLAFSLREAMYSEVNSNFIWKTCQTEFIADEKIYSVARIVGYVLMGFLHPEDMANEMRDALGIDIRIATTIVDAINQRIFGPLRADIDKVYNPASGLVAPKIIEEIHPAPKTSVLAPVSPPSPIAGLTLKTVRSVFKPEPVKSASPKATPPRDEFAQLGENATPAASAPKPVLLQSESIARPIPNAPNFRVPTIAEDIMANKKISEPFPSKAAVVDFGKPPLPKTVPIQQPAGIPKVTVIRYGNEKSSSPMMPPKPEPARTITEITSTAVMPKPTVPPKPPVPPMPTPNKF